MTSIAARNPDAPAGTRDPQAVLRQQAREPGQDGRTGSHEAGLRERELRRALRGDAGDGSGRGAIRAEGTGSRDAGSGGPGAATAESGDRAGSPGSATGAGRSAGGDTQASGAGGQTQDTGAGYGEYSGQRSDGGGDASSGDGLTGGTWGSGGGAAGGTVSRE
jgi:hypothetical protein